MCKITAMILVWFLSSFLLLLVTENYVPISMHVLDEKLEARISHENK